MKKKKNKEPEVKLKVELVDSLLLRSLLVSACVYLSLYIVISLVYGDAFAAFIATPFTTISFFITSRWDRLRDSKTIGLRYILSLLKLDWKNIILTFILIFSFQAVIGILHTVYLIIFQRAYYLETRKLNAVERMTADWQTLVFTILMLWSSYFVAGYFSAKYALRKGFAPYKHALLSTSIYFFVSVNLMSLLFYLSTGQQLIPKEESVGFKVIPLLQYILMPLLGARLALRKVISANKKRNDEK